MKKTIYFIVFCFLSADDIFSQCDIEINDITCCGCYGIQIGPESGPEPGWTYSWSPTTYLDNPNVCNPNAIMPLNTKMTYTLTVTAPGCGTFNAGSVYAYNAGPPVVTPKGPITYYYPFEGVAELTLTSTLPLDGDNVTWYKNGVATVSTGATYTVTLTGANNGTDYYKTASQCGFSNTVALTYHGCVNDNEFPVPVDQTHCLSEFPINVSQPNMGINATYSWDTQNHPSCYSFSNVTNAYDNTATFGPSTGCSFYPEGIVTRALATSGSEVRMVIGVGVNLGCRMMQSEVVNSEQQPYSKGIVSSKNKMQIYPNPTSGNTVITAQNKLVGLEIYTNSGQLVNKYRCNGSSTFSFNTTGLRPGTYVCRANTLNGIEYSKLIVIQK